MGAGNGSGTSRLGCKSQLAPPICRRCSRPPGAALLLSASPMLALPVSLPAGRCSKCKDLPFHTTCVIEVYAWVLCLAACSCRQSAAALAAALAPSLSTGRRLPDCSTWSAACAESSKPGALATRRGPPCWWVHRRRAYRWLCTACRKRHGQRPLCVRLRQPDFPFTAACLPLHDRCACSLPPKHSPRLSRGLSR